MKTLIKMTDFVKEQKEARNCLLSHNAFGFYRLTTHYANFLSLTPQIWMFVPCDSEGNVLREPNVNDWKDNTFCTTGLCQAYYDELAEYQQAKERCYFDGFEVIKSNHLNSDRVLKLGYNKGNYFIYDFIDRNFQDYNDNFFKTLEDLIPYNLTLTATAQKEIV